MLALPRRPAHAPAPPGAHAERGPAALERWVANATLTFHLSDSLTVPLSVVYSDNQEFIEADEVRGKFGFSFSFDNDARTK